jgi:hypothetical protein
MVGTHERAFRRLLPELPPVRTVTIVGGGLFPRTSLALRRILPAASVTILDASREHLTMAEPFLDPDVRIVCDVFDHARPPDSDLVIVPLDFVGDRDAIYRHACARAVMVHDWIWSARGKSTIVSWLLLKRLNLILHARS